MSLARDLVDLVEEDDPHRLDSLECIGRDVLVVDELVELLLEENAPCFGDFHRALLRTLGQHVLEHVGDVAHSFGCALRHHHVEHHRRRLRDFDLDFPLLELTVD